MCVCLSAFYVCVCGVCVCVCLCLCMPVPAAVLETTAADVALNLLCMLLREQWTWLCTENVQKTIRLLFGTLIDRYGHTFMWVKSLYTSAVMYRHFKSSFCRNSSFQKPVRMSLIIILLFKYLYVCDDIKISNVDFKNILRKGLQICLEAKLPVITCQFLSITCQHLHIHTSQTYSQT